MSIAPGAARPAPLWLLPVAVGLFGLSDILLSAGSGARPVVYTPRLRELLPTRQEMRDSTMPIVRGNRGSARLRSAAKSPSAASRFFSCS